MRIAFISDTHIPDDAPEIPRQVKQIFSDVDLILHAGDIYVSSVLDELESLAPVLAAQGDNDIEIIGDKRVKMKHMFTVDGFKIWLTHERRWVWNKDDWLACRPNIVVVGHTHKTKVAYQKEGYLLINPGSPTFPNYKHVLGTVGILTLDSGKVKTDIIQLK